VVARRNPDRARDQEQFQDPGQGQGLLTTWPAFTEAMYLLSRAGGAAGQDALWRLLTTGRLRIAELSEASVERARQMMTKYADLPMDLADATLVALAEQRRERRVFTLDDDFRVYRLHGRSHFEIIPD
jgi:predicted nucleic acid-binding protein